MSDAADAIVVTGGTRVTSVVAEEVRLAAARVTTAADHLRTAAGRCSEARTVVAQDVLLWAGPQPGLHRARAAALEVVDEVARRLWAAAELYDLLGWRLLRAAGLYEEAESVATRIVGALVTAEGFVQGAFWSGGNRWLAAAAAGGVLATLARRTGTPAVLFDGVAPWATRAAAPWSDELVAGLGAGVAWSHPRAAGGDLSTSGGARVLADAVRRAPIVDVPAGLTVTQLQAGDFGSGGLPEWADSGGSLADSLRRVADLYPWAGDAPYATVAVQRVAAPDGGVSWTVLIPGTESVLPADHPWDAVTDLDLMARQQDGASATVQAALAAAGAGPDEPVTLVGHSLGGIAAMALASAPAFTDRYRLGGVVTAGAPVAQLASPPGVPALHLETPQELVSNTDGRSSAENPRTADRVTVARDLAGSQDPGDRAASGNLAAAHGVATHARTLDLAMASGDVRVAGVVARIEPLLDGKEVTTTFYRAERAPVGISP
ncbi:hypothetical protein [Antribacter gilvus]|uniref:hypothetical protein n=1 Tax=Antribacter gilvus TaxID=2304675 RepID=UPI000F787960|nr:hypothetical protein [Antribacter gilvus]